MVRIPIKKDIHLYDTADKVIAKAKTAFAKMFMDIKPNLLNIDELNIIKKVKAFYKELNDYSEFYLLFIAKDVYTQFGGKKFDKNIVKKVLKSFDPVTLYMYTHEVERKRQRFEESIIALVNLGASIDEAVEKAYKLWFHMFEHYADATTDASYLDALKQQGVDRVMWVAEIDERTCAVCMSMDGNIYDIDDVPPKQHLNCRCYVIPVGY